MILIGIIYLFLNAAQLLLWQPFVEELGIDVSPVALQVGLLTVRVQYSPKSKVCPRLLPPRLFLKFTFPLLGRGPLK